jgi:hypothetical protein
MESTHPRRHFLQHIGNDGIQLGQQMWLKEDLRGEIVTKIRPQFSQQMRQHE